MKIKPNFFFRSKSVTSVQSVPVKVTIHSEMKTVRQHSSNAVDLSKRMLWKVRCTDVPVDSHIGVLADAVNEPKKYQIVDRCR